MKLVDKWDTREILKENLSYCGGRVLDLGCGDGKYKEIILTKASEYIGLDAYKHENVDVVADAAQLPFEAASFETIVCLQVLEHVKEPWQVVAEIARVLKPGGQVILNTPWQFPYHAYPDDYYRFSGQALTYLFKKNNLKIIKLESRGGRARVISGYNRLWIKNKWLNKIMVCLPLVFEEFFNRSNKNNLDTPSHLIIGQKV